MPTENGWTSETMHMAYLNIPFHTSALHETRHHLNVTPNDSKFQKTMLACRQGYIV